MQKINKFRKNRKGAIFAFCALSFEMTLITGRASEVSIPQIPIIPSVQEDTRVKISNSPLVLDSPREEFEGINIQLTGKKDTLEIKDISSKKFAVTSQLNNFISKTVEAQDYRIFTLDVLQPIQSFSLEALEGDNVLKFLGRDNNINGSVVRSLQASTKLVAQGSNILVGEGGGITAHGDLDTPLQKIVELISHNGSNVVYENEKLYKRSLYSIYATTHAVVTLLAENGNNLVRSDQGVGLGFDGASEIDLISSGIGKEGQKGNYVYGRHGVLIQPIRSATLEGERKVFVKAQYDNVIYGAKGVGIWLDSPNFKDSISEEYESTAKVKIISEEGNNYIAGASYGIFSSDGNIDAVAKNGDNNFISFSKDGKYAAVYLGGEPKGEDSTLKSVSKNLNIQAEAGYGVWTNAGAVADFKAEGNAIIAVNGEGQNSAPNIYASRQSSVNLSVGSNLVFINNSSAGRNGPSVVASVGGSQINLSAGELSFTDDRYRGRAFRASSGTRERPSVLNIHVGNKLDLQAPDSIVLAADSYGTVQLDASGVNYGVVKGDIQAQNEGAVINVSSKNTELTGDLSAINGAEVDVVLSGRSSLEGSADNFKKVPSLVLSRNEVNSGNQETDRVNGTSLEEGIINLSLRDNSSWKVTANSFLSRLQASSSELDLSKGGYKVVYADFLNGSNNTIKERIDMAADSEENLNGDKLYIRTVDAVDSAGTPFGKLDVIIERDGGPEKMKSSYLVRLEGVQGGSFVLEPAASSFSALGSDRAYKLLFEPDDKKITDSTKTYEDLAAEGYGTTASSGESGNFILVRSKQEDTPETDVIKNIGTSYGQYLNWRNSVSDLRQRLGEVRYGAAEGPWIKGIYDRERASGLPGKGFKQKTYGIHFGADAKAYSFDNGYWLAGASFRYSHSDQKNFSAANNGDGDLESYLAKIYGTFVHDNGTYFDLVGNVGYFQQKLKGLNNNRSGIVKSKYNTWGAGVSAETGRRISISPDANEDYFIEPQFELSYFRIQGKNWTTSTGMKVKQNGVNSLLGRIGVVGGKKIDYGKESGKYLELAVKAGFNHEFMGRQTVRINDSTKFRTDLGGTTFYYGAEADWKVNRSDRLYMQVERETGNNYRKDLSFKVGLQHSF